MKKEKRVRYFFKNSEFSNDERPISAPRIPVHRPFTGAIGNLDSRLALPPMPALRKIENQSFLPPPLPEVTKDGTEAPPLPADTINERDPGLTKMDMGGFSQSVFKVSGFGHAPVEKFVEMQCSAIKTID